MTSLLREEDTPIYNMQYNVIEKSSFFTQKYKEAFKDKDIYIVTSKLYRNAEDTIRSLESDNFEVIEKVAEYDYTELPYLHYLDTWEIYKVRYKAEIYD